MPQQHINDEEKVDVPSFEENTERLKEWLFDSFANHSVNNNSNNDNNNSQEQQLSFTSTALNHPLTEASSPKQLKQLIQKYCNRSKVREIQVAFENCHSERYRAYYAIPKSAFQSKDEQIDEKNHHMDINNHNESMVGGRIVLCADKIKTRQEFETVLTHELMHMFDHCSWNANFRSEEELTCSELRASAVGECVPRRRKLQQPSMAEHEKCAKLHAIKNMQGYGHSKQKSEELVRNAFYKCYRHLLLQPATSGIS